MSISWMFPERSASPTAWARRRIGEVMALDRKKTMPATEAMVSRVIRNMTSRCLYPAARVSLLRSMKARPA